MGMIAGYTFLIRDLIGRSSKGRCLTSLSLLIPLDGGAKQLLSGIGSSSGSSLLDLNSWNLPSHICSQISMNAGELMTFAGSPCCYFAQATGMLDMRVSRVPHAQVGQLDTGCADLQLAWALEWYENCKVGWLAGVQLGWHE